MIFSDHFETAPSTFFALRHHRRGVHYFQGSPRRCEQLAPPFRSHGRLAQLPGNRGGSVGGNEAAFVSLSPRFLSNRYPDKKDFTVSI